MNIDDFTNGLRVLSNYVSGYALGSGHDEVYVYGVPTMPDTVTQLLDKLGWFQQFIDEDDNTSTWIAYL